MGRPTILNTVGSGHFVRLSWMHKFNSAWLIVKEQVKVRWQSDVDKQKAFLWQIGVVVRVVHSNIAPEPSLEWWTGDWRERMLQLCQRSGSTYHRYKPSALRISTQILISDDPRNILVQPIDYALVLENIRMLHKVLIAHRLINEMRNRRVFPVR